MGVRYEQAPEREAPLKAGQTRWKIVRLPDRPGLDVQLVVDTTAPAVVEAIEQAAAQAGVWLVREEEQADAAV